MAGLKEKEQEIKTEKQTVVRYGKLFLRFLYRLQSKQLYSEASEDFQLKEKRNICFRNNVAVSILEAGRTAKRLMP